MMEMLAAWLQQQDNVSQPSWSVLRTALEEIGERQLASEINVPGELQQTKQVDVGMNGTRSHYAEYSSIVL